MLRENKPEIKKIDTEETYATSEVSGLSFSREIHYEKTKGYEAEMRQEMSYGELADGIKNRDPKVFLFIRLGGGFAVGLLSGIAAIGSAVAASGNSDGYFMIGFVVFFTALFLLIIIEQRRKHKRKV